MRFWDSSAIVPLLLAEPERERVVDALARDPVMVVWWGSPVECVSAIARREREGHLLADQASSALERMRALAASWHEIQPTRQVRALSQRLLRTHALRAADALQLAAAIVASERQPETLDLVSLDRQLVTAARREGFRIT